MTATRDLVVNAPLCFEWASLTTTEESALQAVPGEEKIHLSILRAGYCSPMGLCTAACSILASLMGTLRSTLVAWSLPLPLPPFSLQPVLWNSISGMVFPISATDIRNCCCRWLQANPASFVSSNKNRKHRSGDNTAYLVIPMLESQ